MSKILSSIYNIRYLDEVAEKKSRIHNINSVVKIIVTLIYIIIVISYDKYNISGLIPMIIYPVVILSLSDLPIIPLLKRMLIVMPLVIFIGIFNPFYDREVIAVFFGIPISGGWISFFSIIIKCALTVFSSLLLIATTGMNNIAFALRKLKIPKIFVMQLLLTYRYISVLLDEISHVWNAYVLRASFQKGVALKDSGSLLGQLLLRTYDRAQRVYNAMVLRGFDGEYNTGTGSRVLKIDIIYLVCWVLFFVIVRYINISELIGSIMTGVI